MFSICFSKKKTVNRLTVYLHSGIGSLADPFLVISPIFAIKPNNNIVLYTVSKTGRLAACHSYPRKKAVSHGGLSAQLLIHSQTVCCCFVFIRLLGREILDTVVLIFARLFVRIIELFMISFCKINMIYPTSIRQKVQTKLVY